MSKTRPHRDVDAIPDLPVAAPAAESSVASAIRSLGTPAFPEAFARIGGKEFQTDQVIVFKSDGSGRIKTLLAQNSIEGSERAQRLAEQYRTRHWAKDPHRPLLTPADDQWRDVVLRATRVENIEDKAYRQSLFIEPRLSAKAALVIRAPDHALYVNFYRGVDRPPFTPEELDAIRRSGDVLVAMIERHFALTNDEAACDLTAVQRLIAEAARERGATLSTREASVCAHIVLGYSIEGIGLILGLSSHSVVSYRRRAFAKLGIGTQKELFSLVLRKRWLLGL